ncbi:hypothetical protein K3495_g11227 [Podosphaera aphanis]|nr:hypothetical protein K3495_g11227 [Podosphaera aphanis]
MGSDEGRFTRVPVLSRTNYEKWFRQVKFKLQAKGVFYTTELSRVEYAWIPRTGSVEKAPPQSAGIDYVPEITYAGDTWNVEKAGKYDQDEAKVLGFLTDCLDDEDLILMDEFTSAKALWEQLKSKYQKTSDSAVQLYMAKIQDFEYTEEMRIDAAWGTLKDYRRKLISADKSLRNTYPDKFLFLILTRKLPKSFTTVLDGFRTQQQLTLDEKIRILQEKEEDKREESYAAFRFQQPSRRRSDVSMQDAPDIQECYLCESEIHLLRNCPYMERAKSYTRELREKDEKRQKRRAKASSSNGKRPESKSTSWTKTKHRPAKTHKFKHGNVAINEESSDMDESSEPESEKEEAVHLSRECISKSSPEDWILDTGATSPMTDKLHLFRGPPKRICRVTIKVGGGELHSDKRGVAIVKCKDGSSTLVKNVFYVPNLGVNLLSARGLCKTGMQGSFDNKNIWIKDKEKLVIHAQQKDGLYIVKHITKIFKDKAFITQPLDGPDLDMDIDSNPDPDESGEENLMSKVDRHYYRKMEPTFWTLWTRSSSKPTQGDVIREGDQDSYNF